MSNLQVDDIYKLLRQGKSQAEIEALAKATQKAPSFDIGIQQQRAFDTDSTSDQIVRGIAGAGARMIGGLNAIDNFVGQKVVPYITGGGNYEKTGKGISFDIIPDEVALKAKEDYDYLQQRKELTNQNAGVYTPQRLEEKRKLEEQSANATGVIENFTSGAKSAADVVSHPSEWTTQGIVEGIFDPVNLIDAGLSLIPGYKAASMVGGTVLKRILAGSATGATLATTSSALGEYNIAKGFMMSDEEAIKQATQSVGGAATFGAALGGGSGLVSSYQGKTPTLKTPQETIDNIEPQPEQNIINTQDAREKIKKQFSLAPEEVNAVANEDIVMNTKSNLELIDKTKEISSSQIELEKQISLQLKEQGIPPQDAYKIVSQQVPLTPEEINFTQLINDGELVDSRLGGMRILDKLQASIEKNISTPDEFYRNLRTAGYKKEVASILKESYKDGNIDVFMDYVSSKVAQKIENENIAIKDNYSIVAQKINETNTIKTQQLDSFIDEAISGDLFDIEPVQRELIHGLNQLGIVEDIKIIKDKLKDNALGQYDSANKTISLTKQGLNRAQTLTHEFTHSATAHLLHNVESFQRDVNTLMNDFKAITDDKDNYAFTNPQEFVAVAFSDPEFATKLNNTQLSDKMKQSLGLDKSFVGSVWDAIVAKFSEAIRVLTGVDFKINKDSYFEALNNTVAKNMQIAHEMAKNTSMPKTELQKLLSHPHIDEILSFSDGISAKSKKYERTILHKGGKYSSPTELFDGSKMFPAQFDTNYSGMFELSKASVKRIKEGKATLDDIQKLKNDISTYENNPVFGYAANPNTLNSINTQTKQIDFKALDKFAEPIQGRGELFGFLKDFENAVKTPIGDFKLDTDYILNKLAQRDNGKRFDFLSYIKPTLERPAYIVKLDEKFHFIKPFFDEKERVKKFLSVISDRDGKVNFVTTTPLKNNDIQKIIRNGEVIRDFTLEGGATELAPVPPRADLESPKASGSMDKSITNKDTKSQDPDMLYSKGKQPQISPLLTDKQNQKAQKIAESKYTNLQNKYNKAIDDAVDSMLEVAMITLDKTAQALVKYPMYYMGAKIDPKKNWFYVSEAQKSVNEITTDFMNLKNFITEQAQNATKELKTALNEKESQLLVRALSGDLDKNIPLEQQLDTKLMKQYEHYRKMIDDNADILVDLGVLSEKNKIKDYLKRYYEKHLEDSPKYKAISNDLANKFYKRKDLTLDERLELGLIEDASFVIANTLAEQNIQIQRAKLLQAIADKFGKDEAIPGYIQIPSDTVKGGIKKFGALSGKYIDKDMFHELMDTVRFGDDMRFLEDALYPMIDHLKVNMTVKNPTTHIYNIMSNTILSYLSGHSRSLVEVLTMIKKDPARFKNLVDTANRYGLNTYLDDVEPTILNNIDTSKDSAIVTVWKNIYLTADSKTGKAIRKAYDWEDKIFKLAGFYDNLQKGMDEKVAFKKANETYVDYSTPVPPALRFLDKSGLSPFLHYQYKSTPQVAKILLKNPAKALGMFYAINLAGASIFSDNENDIKPEWAKDKLNLFGMKEWVKLGNGWYFNAGRMIPGTKFEYDIGGFISSIINLVNQKDPLTDAPITNPNHSVAQNTYAMIAAIMETFLPSMTVGRYPLRAGEILAAKTGLVEPRNKVTDAYGELLTFDELGARALGTRRFNEAKEIVSKENKAIKDANEKIANTDDQQQKTQYKKELDQRLKDLKNSAKKYNINTEQYKRDEKNKRTQKAQQTKQERKALGFYENSKPKFDIGF